VDKPLSPSAGKSTPKMSKPRGREDMEDPAGAKGGAKGVPTSPSDASLGCDVVPQFPRLEPTEHPEASP
jgi:hypothetical protein